MKNTLIKVGIVILTFVATVLITSKLINYEDTDLTSEMEEAVFPVVTIQYNNIATNRLYGYVSDMELSYMRDTITPLMPGRKMQIVVDTYGTTVLKMSYEIRTINASRLIEDTPIENFTVDSRKIVSDIVVKDLIENNKEYEFILKLQLNDGRIIKYYTRIISPEEYHVADKLEYVSSFSNKTFSKATAEELTKYLEPNSQGNNSSFGYVNIHSKFDQVTWGDLKPLRMTDPVISIKELSPLTGSFVVEYYVSVDDATNISYYKIKEFFRVKYSKDRMYLLDYERTMDQVFSDTNKVYDSGSIYLGITSGNEKIMENEDGSVVAFVAGGRLYSYNQLKNSVSSLFKYYDEFTTDVRLMNDDHDIKIMDVDEAGNVTFLVYGYMNRGTHEGEVGTTAYYYDATVNTIEELLYIQSNHAPDLLMSEISQLSYFNSNGMLYILTGSTLYCIDSKEHTYEIIAEDLTEGSYYTSSNNRMVVWQVGDDNLNCQKLILMNLDTMKQTSIDVRNNETLMPFGFMGEDLIYGVAKKSDITLDRTGNTVVPMFCIRIFNENDGEMMNYQQDNVYITDCAVSANLITLTRVSKDNNGELKEIYNDQIMNAEDVSATKNKISVVSSPLYENIAFITLTKPLNPDNVKHLNPKLVLYEDDRNIEIDAEDSSNTYIVYGKYGVDSFYMSTNNAVERAYEISGIVMDKDGDYVWKRTARSTKNQIMSIVPLETSSPRSSLAICLDTMIELQGVVRNSEYMLSQGQSIIEILDSALDGFDVLDLTGCSLDMVLYYVNLDIPVFALLDNDEAVLIIGFNETEIVIFDPLKTELEKVDMDNATEMFEKNGNRFITYSQGS